MTVKEAIEYIISKSKDDESLLTDTKRFWAYLIDLSSDYRKELNVIKRSLDSEFLELCFKSEDDLRRRVFRMKYHLENQGIAENWIDFIIDSFFSPLGWKHVEDEEKSSLPQQKQEKQKRQTQKQQIQKQQVQKQQIQKQQTQKQQKQPQQTQKQQTQPQQTQKQQTQKQQTQKQQTQKQQIQKQQTQKQQTQKQQTQKQQTQKQQTQASSKRKKQNGVWGSVILFLFFIGLFISVILLSNLNENDVKEPIEYSTEGIVNKDGYIEVILDYNVLKQLGYEIKTEETKGLYTQENGLTWSGTEIRNYIYNKGKEVYRLDIPSAYTYFGKKYKITKIGGRAFYSCKHLAKIILPNTIISIGEESFWGCYSLDNLTIPDSVNNIGKAAFANCSSLTRVNISNRLTKIDDKVFKGCSSLDNIKIPNGVTKINRQAFEDCSSLKNVTIPNSVTHIFEYAFKGCSSVENVIILNSVTFFGYSSFEDVPHVEYHGKISNVSAPPPWGAKSMN